MLSHVTLDNVEYLLYDERAINRTLANQMAAQIGSGAGDYDDLLGFNAWLQDDWKLGVGKKDPEAGGFLFATADTRFGGQFSLSPALGFRGASVNFRVSPAYTIVGQGVGTQSNLTIGPDEDIVRVAVSFALAEDEIFEKAFVLLKGDDAAQEAIVSVYSSTGLQGAPNALIESVTVSLDGATGYHYHVATFTPITGPVGTTEYFLVVSAPTATTLTIPTVVEVDPDVAARNQQYDGVDWADGRPSLIAFWPINPLPDPVSHIVQFNNASYYAAGEKLYRYDADELLEVYDATETITDLMALDGRLYIGRGDDDPYATMDDAELVTESSVPARLFLLHNGLLWRAVGPDVFYTDDENDWPDISPGAINVGLTDRETVRGMAGLNGEMIVSTNRSLYRVIEGDVVLQITPWNAPDDSNGEHMLAFQGNIYITLAESLIRFDGDNLLPYGPDLDEGLPAEFAGNIIGIAANNNWLLVGIAGTQPSIWIHNGQGWHHLVSIPAGNTLTTIGYAGASSNLSTVAAGTSEGLILTAVLPDNKRTLKAQATEDWAGAFANFGWLETDWFYGSLREVQKDWESVYVDGVDIDTTNYVEVYWMGETDTDWNLLGTVTSPTQELRWSDLETRPTGRRIRIGIGLYNGLRTGSPLITAVRVKYMPMITDRWRWQFPLAVHDNAESPDGDTNGRNVAEMLQHLDGLIKQVKPFIYRDEDDIEYEVKIMSGNRRSTKTSYDAPSISLERQYVYDMVLEQVTASAYQVA